MLISWEALDTLGAPEGSVLPDSDKSVKSLSLCGNFFDRRGTSMKGFAV
jgi:hypothetical protein